MTELNEVIQQRRGRYGPLIESGEVAMKLEDYLRSLPGWERLAYDQREALAMVMHKISRIMCGDPNYDDSWVDIAGYVQNVVNRLREEQQAKAEEAPFSVPTPDDRLTKLINAADVGAMLHDSNKGVKP